MFYLVLSALSSIAIIMAFKFFDKYQIDTFQAIVINYWVCVFTGSIVLGQMPVYDGIFSSTWMSTAWILGTTFIAAFYFVGLSVIYFGLAVTSVVQRMSLVISVPFAIVMFSEPATALKITGLIAALLSVIFINIPSKKDKNKPITPKEDAKPLPKGIIFYPVLAFLVSGLVECLLQYSQRRLIGGDPSEEAIFSIWLFGVAAFIGSFAALGMIIFGKSKFELKNLIGGIGLGIPNYFSIYFLLRAFSWKDVSIILPINNLSVVGGAALIGFFLFRERLSKLNWLGVLLAALAIILIAF
ncbi:MAG: hypothetical protein GY810_10595 [Aureispira sp.]|nr:hypothetical protein [Aureispira sp.]